MIFLPAAMFAQLVLDGYQSYWWYALTGALSLDVVLCLSRNLRLIDRVIRSAVRLPEDP